MRIDPVLNFLRGFLMGMADVVPGVSGGTIAVLVGIYERLVHSVSMASKALGNVLRLRFREAARRLGDIEWSLIIPLLIGIATAILLLAGVISHLLETYPEAMAGAFAGLVAAFAQPRVDHHTPHPHTQQHHPVAQPTPLGWAPVHPSPRHGVLGTPVAASSVATCR